MTKCFPSGICILVTIRELQQSGTKVAVQMTIMAPTKYMQAGCLHLGGKAKISALAADRSYRTQLANSLT